METFFWGTASSEVCIYEKTKTFSQWHFNKSLKDAEGIREQNEAKGRELRNCAYDKTCSSDKEDFSVFKSLLTPSPGTTLSLDSPIREVRTCVWVLCISPKKSYLAPIAMTSMFFPVELTQILRLKVMLTSEIWATAEWLGTLPQALWNCTSWIPNTHLCIFGVYVRSCFHSHSSGTLTLQKKPFVNSPLNSAIRSDWNGVWNLQRR